MFEGAIPETNAMRILIFSIIATLLAGFAASARPQDTLKPEGDLGRYGGVTSDCNNLHATRLIKDGYGICDGVVKRSCRYSTPPGTLPQGTFPVGHVCQGKFIPFDDFLKHRFAAVDNVISE